MSKLPPFDMAQREVMFFVLKFHLQAHIEKCQTTYSFNFLPGVGWTDGEAPEQGWANINPIASRTKEMGLGAHQDVLNDHFSHSNWQKIVGICKYPCNNNSYTDVLQVYLYSRS